MGRSQQRLVGLLLVLPCLAVAMHSAPPAGYAEISDPGTEVLAKSVGTLSACKESCDNTKECQGIKYVKHPEADKGDCSLLLGPPDAALPKAASLPEKSAVHVIISAKAKDPAPATQVIAGIDQMQSAIEEADAGLKKIGDLSSGKKKAEDKPMVTPKLLRKVKEAKTKTLTCEFAKKLHEKYIKTVVQEVQLDEKKERTKVSAAVEKEVKRANKMVQKRAEREAEREVSKMESGLEKKVMAMLEEENGQMKAQRFLHKLQADACEIKPIKTSEIPKIPEVDTWKTCADMKDRCKTDADVQKNCAQTCIDES